jgi:hypothetical protein
VDVHVGQHSHLGVTRIHPPHVRAERNLPPVLIGGVREVVVLSRVARVEGPIPIVTQGGDQGCHGCDGRGKSRL